MPGIYFQSTSRLDELFVEGQLSGDRVDELERCWQALASSSERRRLVVDVSHVDAVDPRGWRLLGRMAGHGVKVCGVARRATGFTRKLRQLSESILSPRSLL